MILTHIGVEEAVEAKGGKISIGNGGENHMAHLGSLGKCLYLDSRAKPKMVCFDRTNLVR